MTSNGLQIHPRSARPVINIVPRIQRSPSTPRIIDSPDKEQSDDSKPQRRRNNQPIRVLLTPRAVSNSNFQAIGEKADEIDDLLKQKEDLETELQDLESELHELSERKSEELKKFKQLPQYSGLQAIRMTKRKLQRDAQQSLERTRREAKDVLQFIAQTQDELNILIDEVSTLQAENETLFNTFTQLEHSLHEVRKDRAAMLARLSLTEDMISLEDMRKLLSQFQDEQQSLFEHGKAEIEGPLLQDRQNLRILEREYADRCTSIGPLNDRINDYKERLSKDDLRSQISERKERHRRELKELKLKLELDQSGGL